MPMTDEQVGKLVVRVCEDASAGDPGVTNDVDDVIIETLREATPEIRAAALKLWTEDLKKWPTYQNAALCGIVLMIDVIGTAIPPKSAE